MFTWFRNLFFDIGILSVKKHAIPIISVGNLSMGGTGKTPMVEYLIRLLQNQFKVATLSRGYGRKTKGFVLADEMASAKTIGDESMQYLYKYNQVKVAVDENRNRGVNNLVKSFPDLDVVLLDDAFQHRWIKPGLSILLTDYFNLYSNDYVFPTGKLREFRGGAKRADIVIVTKTPVVLSPITRRRIAEELKLKEYQLLLFTKIIYDGLVPFLVSTKKRIKKRYSHIVLFTGIANNYPIQEYLQPLCSELTVLSYGDHHIYTQEDIDRILEKFNEVFTKDKILVTTEKDAMRLQSCCEVKFSDGTPLYYVPIRTVFHNGDGDLFSKKILDFLPELSKTKE